MFAHDDNKRWCDGCGNIQFNHISMIFGICVAYHDVNIHNIAIE